MKRLAIFVSGRGTNMDNIIKKKKQGCIKADIALVVSDVKTAPALEKAKRHGVETVFIDPKKFKTKVAFERAVVKELRARSVDIIVLAGFMRILTPYILKLYKNKILNIHPALLPSFKGMHGIRDAYEAGVKITGVTVHFATEALDGGPIIIQETLEIRDGETLASLEKRIHALEYELYPRAIHLVINNTVKVKGNEVYRIK